VAGVFTQDALRAAQVGTVSGLGSALGEGDGLGLSSGVGLAPADGDGLCRAGLDCGTNGPFAVHAATVARHTRRTTPFLIGA